MEIIYSGIKFYALYLFKDYLGLFVKINRYLSISTGII